MKKIEVSILSLGIAVMAGISSCNKDQPTVENQISTNLPQASAEASEEVDRNFVDTGNIEVNRLTLGNEMPSEDFIFPSEYFKDGIEITPIALAELEPTVGNKTTGLVSFIKTDSGTRVIARLTDIPPGEHGFHVHETGDCSAPDASSAGGHFNPHQKMHGSRQSEERHIGDLGNISGTENELALVDFYDQHLGLEGPTSIIGKAVVIHSGKDDMTSQPSGDAGQRIACGVIELHQAGNSIQD